jgi:hypothetical protein
MPEEIEELEHNRYDELRDAEEEIATFLSDEFVITAHELDARLPASDDNTFWARSDPFTSYLNVTGRDLMRTRIKEVKDRNFDDRARWFKFFMLARHLVAVRQPYPLNSSYNPLHHSYKNAEY